MAPGSAAAAVAATESPVAVAKPRSGPALSRDPVSTGALVLSAALALPGLLPTASAEPAPSGGMIGLRNLSYRESQPGLERVGSNSPSLVFLLPLAGEWALSGDLVTDNVSGASPRYHTAISGASQMKDRRNAADLQLKRYLEDGSVSVGLARSNENDYGSTALSLQSTVDSKDRNTTLLWGLGGASDKINPVNLAVHNEQRHSIDAMLGVAQVLTPADLVQFSLGYNRGRGYFSDPYKIFDNRPRQLSQTTLSAKWNHHFDAADGTSRFSYRYGSNSDGVRSHTLGKEYVQAFAEGWSVTPGLRYYSQSAARFYVDPTYDPLFGAPFPAGVAIFAHPLLSMDQRLSAFGALTLEAKLARQLSAQWSADLKLARYEQRSAWRWFGRGSPGLAPLTAHWFEIGLYRRW